MAVLSFSSNYFSCCCSLRYSRGSPSQCNLCQRSRPVDLFWSQFLRDMGSFGTCMHCRFSQQSYGSFHICERRVLDRASKASRGWPQHCGQHAAWCTVVRGANARRCALGLLLLLLALPKCSLCILVLVSVARGLPHAQAPLRRALMLPMIADPLVLIPGTSRVVVQRWDGLLSCCPRCETHCFGWQDWLWMLGPLPESPVLELQAPAEPSALSSTCLRARKQSSFCGCNAEHHDVIPKLSSTPAERRHPQRASPEKRTDQHRRSNPA